MLETVIGSSASMAIRNLLLMIGGLVMLTLTSAQAHAARAGRRAAGRRADHPVRPARAQARAREPGSRRRRRRLRRRVAARDPHRAGLRARRRRSRAHFGERVEAAFATAVRRMRQRALLVAAVIVLVFGAVGVILWIGGHDVFAGRLSAGPAVGVRVLRGDRRRAPSGTISEVDRRPAARGRRHRAAVRAARGRAGDSRAGASGAAARRPRAAPSHSRT